MTERSASARSRISYRWLIALSIVLLAAAGTILIGLRRDSPPEPVRPETAVGDANCLSCHRDKATYEQTAHRNTTRLPTADVIEGSFRTGENVLRTPSPYVHFRMDANAGGFYQTAVIGKGADTTSRTERIAYVAGSGRKGQSFFYWAGDRLFQLPVSWWTSLGRWINSPGPAYADGTPNFERRIAPRCLECHATWMENVPGLGTVNRYQPTGAILGITCERCHGAGQEHVARERSVLRAVRPPAIVNAARLTRDRKMDACAQCHAGLGDPKVPSFTYVAGKVLDNYLSLPAPSPDATVDVHGNQLALLSRSKCFRSSQMTCLTCHDVHRQQRDVAQISGTCLTCHTEQSCGLFAAQGHALAGRCVDCHMPLQTSNLIVSALDGKAEQARVRTHWIRVYENAVEKAADGTR